MNTLTGLEGLRAASSHGAWSARIGCLRDGVLWGTGETACSRTDLGIATGGALIAVVPSLFGTSDQCHGRQFSHGLGQGGKCFGDDSSVLHLLCTLFLLLLHHLHLRSSGIRSQMLGPNIPYEWDVIWINRVLWSERWRVLRRLCHSKIPICLHFQHQKLFLLILRVPDYRRNTIISS